MVRCEPWWTPTGGALCWPDAQIVHTYYIQYAFTVYMKAQQLYMVLVGGRGRGLGYRRTASKGQYSCLSWCGGKG